MSGYRARTMRGRDLPSHPHVTTIPVNYQRLLSMRARHNALSSFSRGFLQKHFATNRRRRRRGAINMYYS